MAAVRIRTVVSKGFMLCALFSLAIVAAAWPANAAQLVPMAVLDTFNQTAPAPGYTLSFVGTFTSIIGTEVVTGASRMDVNVVPGPGATLLAYCKFTWVSSAGTLVVQSVCVFGDGHGTWHVESGTGRYEKFKAVGTQTFGPLPAGGPFTDYERFAGFATNDGKGGND
jgi:hypothetical protein